MSVAAEELRDQLSQTRKNEVEELEKKAESKGINHFATFPWLYGILRKCREAIGSKHTYTLDGLLYALVKELSVSIKDCYGRPNRAGKLRDIVCQMLVYFNMIYRDLKAEYDDNNNTYLHLMTELLAIYLDLEIKASRRGVHSLKKIGQFMTTALYTHLGQSEDHIIEAILKAKLITKSSGELCAPVLFKVLNDGRCFIGDENAYVRFLLAFKLLHKITRRTDRFDVTKMAMRKLDPAPELVRIVRRMNHIFPSQKIMDEPITVFLMNAKFDFIKAKLEFLRTGSISKGCPTDIYPDKPFTYGNRSNSITNLLKHCRKDEERSDPSIYDTWSKNRNKRGCSTDLDLDPSIYSISLHSEDKVLNEKHRWNEDDSNEIEFLGTRNKRDKPVVLITLDSDDEAYEKEVKETQTVGKPVAADCLAPSEDNKGAEEIPKEQDEKKNKNYTLTVGSSSDMKSESYEDNSSTKVINLREREENLDSGENEENMSTKHEVEALPSNLQSPEHGVIDSTNNFIDSDERPPMRQTCPADSSSRMVDESRAEVSSSLDFVYSTPEKCDEDCLNTRELEITSTRDKSDPFTSTGVDVSNTMKDLNYPLNNDSLGKKLDIACSVSPLIPSNFSENANYCTRSVITSGPLMSEKDTNNCSSIYSSNTELNNKYERMNIIQNYSPTIMSVTSKRKEEPSKIDSVVAGEPTICPTCQPGVIQRTNEGKVQLGIVNDTLSKHPQQCLFEERALGGTGQRSFGMKRLVNEPLNQTPKEGKIAQNGKGEMGSKNFTLASGNLNKLIGTPAKKVNFENVAKSYKIVKSNRLKTSELSRSPDGHSKDAPDRNGNRTPKFIRIDKSGFIGNSLKIKERLKFVSKSLDFRTLKTDGDVSKRGREERGSTKTVEGKSVRSRMRTNQCVPIIFKKIDETRCESTERKRKSSPRGATDGKSSRSSQTTKRKRKSQRNSNVIKTDINMKSTLKHINPSSIPQFAADVSKDRKRKYAVAEPNVAKVKCVGNYNTTDTPENKTVEIKLVVPDKFLGLKNSDAFQGHEKETSVMPIVRPSAVQFPSNQESTSYASIHHSNGTQEGSFNQLPTVYQTEPTLYCKKPDQPQKVQNGVAEPSQRFFVSENVEVTTEKLELQKENSIPFEPGYQDIFPVLNCDEVKNPEMENEKLDVSNEDDITGLVERQEGLNISDDRRSDSHDRASSLEVGMAFSNVWSSGKVTSNTPRDLVISEISEEELKDVDEELREFVEPWEGPRDCCPDDDEFFLSALPDPQKLFSEEDFSRLLDVTFPPSNLSLETLRPEDFGQMDAFDEKCLCDLREKRDFDMLESTFNENFFVLQEKFMDCDVPHADDKDHLNHYESCKKSARLPSPESRNDDQPKPCFEKGRRSSSSSSRSSSSSSSCSSSGRNKAGSSRSKTKPNTKENIRSKLDVLIEGGTEKVDKKKLRSDSVAYHTRSISQKGIPIEYTLPPPKRVKSKRNRPS